MAFLLGAGFGGTLAFGVDAALDWPPACKAALAAASQHPGVQHHCGAPLRASLMWDGAVGEDMAFVTIPVSGPSGSAILRARVLRDKAGWVPAILHAEIEGEVFNLLTAENSASGISASANMQMDICRDSGRQHDV